MADSALTRRDLQKVGFSKSGGRDKGKRLTSTIVSDIRLRTQTSLELVANSVARTVFVMSTADDFVALRVGIWIRDRSFRTFAAVASGNVPTNRSRSATVGFRTLVDVLTLDCGVSRETLGTLTGEAPSGVLADSV